MWEKIGKLQFEFIKDQGLKPDHKFLDVGCGSMRGGVHFVKYLASGNYFGMDKEAWILEAAREVEIPKYGLENKKVTLIDRGDFDFSVFNQKFDYAIAQWLYL